MYTASQRLYNEQNWHWKWHKKTKVWNTPKLDNHQIFFAKTKTTANNMLLKLEIQYMYIKIINYKKYLLKNPRTFYLGKKCGVLTDLALLLDMKFHY